MKLIYALALCFVFAVNGYSQQMKLDGKWKLDLNNTGVNGTATFNVDTIVTIKQEGNEITFERFGKARTEEKTKLNEEVSSLVANNTTKSIRIEFSNEEQCYVMTSTYKNPEKPVFTFIQKWLIDQNGNLIRWMIEPDVYSLMAVYNRVKE